MNSGVVANKSKGCEVDNEFGSIAAGLRSKTKKGLHFIIASVLFGLP